MLSWQQTKCQKSSLLLIWAVCISKLLLHNKPFFFFFLILYWGIVDLQCCVNFCYIAKWFSYTQICFIFKSLPLNLLFLTVDCWHIRRLTVFSWHQRESTGMPCFLWLLWSLRRFLICLAAALLPESPAVIYSRIGKALTYMASPQPLLVLQISLNLF